METPQPVKQKKRFKIEPEPGGQLEQLLIENKKAYDAKEEAAETEAETKARIKAFLLSLFPDGTGLPDAFDIAGDPHGRYPGYSLTLKSGKRFNSKLFLADAGEELYQRYEVAITPTWELRENTGGRR
jgi:hypothetical protein